MTAKQSAAKGRKQKKQRLAWCKKFWPEVNAEADLWHRKRAVGFATLPRTMPHILAIIDALTKGKPASLAYLTLWCRSTDEMVIRIQNPVYLAAESGFSGERQVSTWQGRMASLEELGFIKVAPGQAGPYEFVLLMNPYAVAKALHEAGKVPGSLYNALDVRAMEIGATDLEDEEADDDDSDDD